MLAAATAEEFPIPARPHPITQGYHIPFESSPSLRLLVFCIKLNIFPILSKINFCSGFLGSTVKLEVNKLPSWISILLKVAILSNTWTVISSKIEKTYDCFPKDPDEVATTPFLRVIVEGFGSIFVVSMKKVILALAAVLDFGKYPIFLAYETTFFLNVALSMKTSLVTMLAL